MITKTVTVEKPYCTSVDYRFELDKFCFRFKLTNLTEKKRAIFERKLELFGYYQGKQVQIICSEEDLDVLPATPYVPPKYAHHPRCGRCTLI